MERKKGLPIVVFDGNTEISDIRRIIPKDFEGDIVINGNLCDYEEKLYGFESKGGLFVIGNLEVPVKTADILLVTKVIEIYESIFIGDLICDSMLFLNGASIVVSGDCRVREIIDANIICVLGDFYCDYDINGANEIFINGEFSCNGEINDVEIMQVKNKYK